MEKDNKPLTELSACAVETIKNFLQSSLFISLHNILAENFDLPDDCFVPDDIKLFKNNFIDDIFQIDKLTEDMAARTNTIAYYSKMKEMVTAISQNLTLHVVDIMNLLNIANYYLAAEHYKDAPDFSYQMEMLAQNCVNYVNTGGTDEDQSFKKADIMATIPLRMTKAKYADYIRDGFFMSAGDIQEHVAKHSLHVFQLELCPRLAKDYGKHFPQTGEALQAAAQMDLSALSHEELHNIIDAMQDLWIKLDETHDILSMIHECCNLAMILYHYANHLDYVLDGNMIYKDLFYAVKEYKDAEMEDEARLRTKVLLEREMENAVDRISAHKQRLGKLVEKSKDGARSDEEENLLTIVFTVQWLFYSDIPFWDSLPQDQESPIITKESFSALIEKTLAKIDAHLAQLPKATRKLIRQFALSRVQCPWDIMDILNYMSFSFEACTTPYSRNVFYHSLASVVSPESIPEENEHGHEHHHHDEHCDCGHHH